MKPILFAIAFIGLTTNCLGQLKTKAFTLTVDFAPAFIEEGKLTINTTADSNAVDLQVIKYTSKNKLVYVYHSLASTDEIIALDKALTNYKYWLDNSKKGKSDLVYGADGITITGIWYQNGIIKKFRYWGGGGSGILKPHSLFGVLFDLMQKSFKDYDDAINYIKRLKTWL